MSLAPATGWALFVTTVHVCNLHNMIADQHCNLSGYYVYVSHMHPPTIIHQHVCVHTSMVLQLQLHTRCHMSHVTHTSSTSMKRHGQGLVRGGE